MQQRAPRSRTWLTRQLVRTWHVGCDAARLVSGLGGVFRSVVAATPPAAGLAALAGETVARIGSPSRYRVRVANPTASTRALRVLVAGWRDDATTKDFELVWDVALAPLETAERWFETTWRKNDACFVVAFDSNGSPPWIVGRTVGRWTIEARQVGAAPADEDCLRICGSLVE